MAEQSEYAVTTYVNQADLDQLLARFEGSDYRVFVLHGDAVASKAALFAQAEKDLPLPEDYRRIHNWSSFEDCLWNMVFNFDEERMAFIWTHVEQMLVSGLEDFTTAADVLITLARRVYEKQIDLSVFFVGEGANFPALSPKA